MIQVNIDIYNEQDKHVKVTLELSESVDIINDVVEYIVDAVRECVPNMEFSEHITFIPNQEAESES